MTYELLDKEIVLSLPKRSSSYMGSHVWREAEKIAGLTGRDSFRVIDGRMQALRKRKEIKFVCGVWIKL